DDSAALASEPDPRLPLRGGEGTRPPPPASALPRRDHSPMRGLVARARPVGVSLSETSVFLVLAPAALAHGFFVNRIAARYTTKFPTPTPPPRAPPSPPPTAS